MLKSFKFIIFLINLHSIPQNDKKENRILEMFENVLKRLKLKYQFSQRYSDPKYSVFSWSTFGSNFQPQVFLGMTRQALHSWIWGFSAILLCSPLKLCQVEWAPSLDNHFQVSPEMFNWVMALAGPLKDIHRVVPKPLLPCLGCVLWVIVLLEGEPLALSAVDQVFIKDVSALCSIQLSLNTDHSPSPCCWKTPPDFIHLRIIEATMLLGTFNAAEFFCILPQICASTQFCLWALQAAPSTSWLGFCSDMHALSAVKPYIDRYVPFQITSNKLNLPLVDYN